MINFIDDKRVFKILIVKIIYSATTKFELLNNAVIY